MATRGPLGVDLARARIDRVPGAAHPLHDVRGVSDVDLGVVRRVVRALEERCRAGHRLVEFRLVDLHAVPLAERPVAFGAKHRARADQREVDVEEDGFRSHSPFPIGSGDDDGRARGVEDTPGCRVDVIERDRRKMFRQSHVVIQAETEKFRRLQKLGNSGVGLECPRHRADEVLL